MRLIVRLLLESRKIVSMNVTRSPSDVWGAQQWRDATPFGNHPKHLIRDNDRKYGPHFAAATAGTASS
jgi:putative transposase